jgi:hypothetical protein
MPSVVVKLDGGRPASNLAKVLNAVSEKVEV